VLKQLKHNLRQVYIASNSGKRGFAAKDIQRMASIVAICIAAVVFFIAVIWVRSATTPPPEMFLEIREALLELQQEASQNVEPISASEKIHGIDLDSMPKKMREVRRTIRFVYTIAESQNGLVHTISSQLLKPKSEKYQAQCMIIAMFILNECLGEAGIDLKSIAFEIFRSEIGTHFLEMSLTRDQHQQIMASILAAPPSALDGTKVGPG
jgi:hypothetical protein